MTRPLVRETSKKNPGNKNDETDDDDDDDDSNNRMGNIFYLPFQMKIKCLPRLLEIGRCATRLSGKCSRIPVNRIIAYLMDL